MSNSNNEIQLSKQFRLDGKVAIVTGASKGIGESIARSLAEFGAKVIVSSRKQEAVDAVAASIRAAGFEAKGIACHVGHEDELKDLVKQTVSLYGSVDILINNAATNPAFGPLSEMDVDVYEKTMSINVKAPFMLANLVYPIMKKKGNGSIVNISSVEGLKPSFGLGLYSVSKSALIMLTKNQAKEWGKDGVRSNVICPGLIKTKFSSAIWQNESLLNSLTKHLPSGRMALPHEMAGLALFLASDAASYCTGGVYAADGGMLLI